jgi:hypothetical protein
MGLRAWQLWGTSAVLTGGLVGLAQSPPVISGRATPAITQDHFQPEAAPPPRMLPQQVREANPPKPALPAAEKWAGNVIGLQAPGVPPPDLDKPIRGFSTGPSIAPFEEGGLGQGWKARAALEVAEMHFEACDLDDARAWYQEVIKLAPGTKCAATAAERLRQTTVLPAGGQSSEPPLADANPRDAQVRIR